MEQQDGGGGLSRSAAVAACVAMAVFYVAALYFPTLILRLPPPDSFKSFMIRRFVSAAVSSVVSLILCFLILPIGRWDASILLGVYGIRMDHGVSFLYESNIFLWQALVFPLLLTSLMYSGTFTLRLLTMFQASNEHLSGYGNIPMIHIKSIFLEIIDWVASTTYSVSAWRNYVVAPLTEELVFRACMIPLLLCGGFSTYTVIFLCPIFFSLAHLNHLLELCVQKKCSFLKACQVVGFQLGYTVIFGAYASFLLLRTGHLAAALVAHIFCNFMGFPVIFSRRSGIISVAFLVGMLSFFGMLFPVSSPHLYNDREDDCRCWNRYCNWN